MSQDLKTDQDYLQHIRDLTADCENIKDAFTTFGKLLHKDFSTTFERVMQETPDEIREAKLDVLSQVAKHVKIRLKELF